MPMSDGSLECCGGRLSHRAGCPDGPGGGDSAPASSDNTAEGCFAMVVVIALFGMIWWGLRTGFF